jgi:hypothetical protein
MDKLAAVMYSGIYVNRNIGAILSVLPTLRAYESMPVAERHGSRLRGLAQDWHSTLSRMTR